MAHEKSDVAAGAVLVAMQATIAVVLVMSSAYSALPKLWKFATKRSIAAAVPNQKRSVLQKVCAQCYVQLCVQMGQVREQVSE
jgi:hypothetical protein